MTSKDLLNVSDMIALRAGFGQPLTLSEMETVAKQLRAIAADWENHPSPPRWPVIPGGKGAA